jgi:hypothetical protein
MSTKAKGKLIYTDEEEDIDEDSGEILEPEVKICLTCMGTQG